MMRKCSLGGLASAMLLASIEIARANPVTPLVAPPQLPSTPPASWATGKATADLTKILRDWLQDKVIQSQVDDSVQKLMPSISKVLSDAKSGYLVKVEIYESAEGVKMLGSSESVDVVGVGTSPTNAALRYFSQDQLSAGPPAGVLKSDRESYLIWITRNAEGFQASEIPYPFSTKVFNDAHLQLLKSREEEVTREQERARQAEAAKQVRAVEAAQQTLRNLDQVRQSQDAVRQAQALAAQLDAARHAQEAAQYAKQAQEQAEAVHQAVEAARQAENARRQIEQMRQQQSIPVMQP